MPEERAAPKALLNFLYKDLSLAKSYYAQIFSGLLKEFQREGNKQEINAAFSRWTFGPRFMQRVGEKKNEERVETAWMEVLDPHDTIHLDLITFLSSSLKDLDLAGHGDLVKATGDCIIMSREFWEFGLDVFCEVVSANPQNFGFDNKKKVKDFVKVLRKLKGAPHFSTRFFLFVGEKQISGYINENFLTESIDALTFKYGHKPIPNVTLIGVLEKPKDKDFSDKFPQQSVEFGIFSSLKALSELITQSDHIVKPIFLYYPTFL